MPDGAVEGEELTLAELALVYWRAIATVRTSDAIPDHERQELVRELERVFHRARKVQAQEVSGSRG